MANVGMVIGRAEEQEGNATRGDVRDGRERMGDIWDIYGIYMGYMGRMDQTWIKWVEFSCWICMLRVDGGRGSVHVELGAVWHCTDIARILHATTYCY